jgi:hypothetical protein
MSHAYHLSTLKIDSDLDLPELRPWDGPAAAPADAVFRLGTVPTRLEAPDHVAPIFQTRGRSEYLLALPGTGRILVRDGAQVTIEPEPGADPRATRAVLAGPIQAVLWHQRGLLPLHANAIAVNGRAVALAGPAASGKSTLAAVLAAMGHRVMADDVCVVDVGAGAECSVLPGSSHLRLWRDALDHLGIAAEGLPRALSCKEQFLVDRPEGFVREARKLVAVVLLRRQSSGAFTIERLRGIGAISALHRVVHMRRPARALGREPEIFAALTQLAAAGVTVWRLRLPDDPACLEEAAAKVLTVLEA